MHVTVSKSPLALVSSLLAVFFYTHAVCAKPSNSPSDGWHLLFAPYGWASAVQGNVSVDHRSFDFHVPFKDILKHLQFAAQGHLEAGYGPLTVMVDPTYLKLTDRRANGLIRPEIISQTILIDAGAFYRIYSKQLAPNQWITFELLGGARYFNMSNTLKFPLDLKLSERTTMSAPIAGGRIKANLTPKTQLWLRGDYGGFHVDHVRKTWSATVGLSYAVAKYVELGIAYRGLKIDFDKSNTAMNVLMQGPMLGIGFHN